MNETEKIKKIKDLMVDYLDGMKGFPKSRKRFEAIARSYTEFISFEPYTHSRLGDIPCPAIWLMEAILRNCEFFPMPVEARQMFEQYFPVADGRTESEFPDLNLSPRFRSFED